MKLEVYSVYDGTIHSHFPLNIYSQLKKYKWSAIIIANTNIIKFCEHKHIIANIRMISNRFVSIWMYENRIVNVQTAKYDTKHLNINVIVNM